MRKFLKRAVSWMLISGMVLAEPLQTFAENKTEVTETEITGQMLDDVPEDGNYVYLGTSSVDIKEGNGIFTLPIYRTGDIEKKASVIIRAISITAQYGKNKDYTLEGKSKTTGITEANLMQLITGTDASGDGDDTDTVDPQVRQYEVQYDTATPSEYGDGDNYSIKGITRTGSYSLKKDEVKEGIDKYNELKNKKATDTEYNDEDADADAELISAGETASEDSDEDADSEKSPLAVIKEQQTGQPTRETEDTEYNDPDLTDDIIGSLLPEYISELPYACEQTISFEAGEDTAYVKFRTYDNSKSDGTRVFSIYLTDPGAAEIYKVSSASVTIEDDEETEHPTISFDSDTYDASGNKAKITVKREGLETSMATAELHAYDVSTGEETALGEVAFLPYENEKEITLNVDHEVTLELTNFKAAEEGENTAAHVTGAKRDASRGGYSVLNVDDGTDDSSDEASDESDIMLLSDDSDELYSAGGNSAADADKSLSANAAVASLASENGSEKESANSNNANALGSSNVNAAADSTSGSDGEQMSFKINLKGKEYEVRYDKVKVEEDKTIKHAPTVGKIYDTTYDPALEVGEYYFSTSVDCGGMYDYSLRWTGDEPWGCGFVKEWYSAQNDGTYQWNGSHGNMQYFSTTMWDEGTVYCSIPDGKSIVKTVLYQVLVPDIASTSNYCWGQKTDFVMNGDGGRDINGKRYSGPFGRCMQDGLALRIKKGSETKDQHNYDYIKPFAKAVDDSLHTPKSFVEYYGFAAMYKYYDVTINNPVAKNFKSFDIMQSYVPVQTEVASGADKLYDKNSKDIYVNSDENKSNLVFKLKKNTVNGKDDVFCKLTGYKITIGTGDNAKTVDYPQGLIDFIKSDDRKTTSLMDYSAEGKAKELKKLEDISTVALDYYFIDWIDTEQKNVISNNLYSSEGYYQKLSFTPVVDYIDVKLTVTGPVSDDGTPLRNTNVAFKDSELKEGSELTYHAGDRLDLTVVSKSDNYKVTGYEVSVDGGVSFNTVRDINELVLLPGHVKGYIIRPCVQANENCIEITYSGSSARKVHVDNVIPQSELAAYPDLKGRYFLDVNPTAADIYERMRPEPGKCYEIDIITDDSSASSSDKVTRPTVTDELTKKTYNTSKHYLIAKKNKSDNRFTIGTEETKKSNISTYTLNGQIVMKAATIRSSAMGYRNVPMIGYTAFTGGTQATQKNTKNGKDYTYVSTISGTVPESAKLSLSGVKGAEGDRITISIDNGVNDAQVEEVVLGKASAKGNDIGQLVTTYPLTAPYFVSVDYEYDKKENSQKVDHRDNTVNCFDDTLTLTASINPNGRTIEKVVFLVQTSTGVSNGVYTAEPKTDDSGKKSNSVFEVKIDKMLERFNNGDRIYAYIVDKEKKKISAGQVSEVPIVYPTMDTGLIMCVENELIKPKNIDLEYNPEKAINLPVIGTPALLAQSGVLSFTKTKNADNTMYMLTVNMDAHWSSREALTFDQKKEKFSEYTDQAKRISVDRKLAAANAMPDGTDQQRLDKVRARAEAIELNESMNRDDYDAAHPNERRGTQAAGRQASLTKDAIIQVEACFTLAWSFVYDAKKNDYVMASMAGTIGGKMQASKTIYWVVGYVPVYLNLTGSVQYGVTMTGIMDEVKQAITEGDFNNTPGNVKDLVGKNFQFNIEGIFIGKISAGVGVNECISARAYGQVSLDIDYIHTWGEMSDNNWGLLISCAAGLGFDLLFISGDIDIIKAQWGFGEFENQSKVSFLGGLVDDDNSKPSAASAASLSEADGVRAVDDSAAEETKATEQPDGNEAALLSANDSAAYAVSDDDEALDEPKVRFRSVGLGTNDFSDFANYADGDEDGDDGEAMLRGIPAIKSKTPLLKNAAEHTRPKLIQLNSQAQMVVFLGASKVNPDESCVYYSIGRGSTWSEPKAIDDDGGFDTTPDVLKVSNDKIMICWANARESLESVAESGSFADKYKVFKISAAFYDIKNKKMGEAFDLQDDVTTYSQDEDEESSGGENKFFNVYPKLSVQGDKIFCTYLKRDVSAAEKAGDEIKILDYKALYSTMAYVTCDPDGRNITKEQCIPVSTAYDDEGNAIKDPLVTDYKVQTFTLKELKELATGTEAGSTKESDAEFIAAIYTIDTDGDFGTSADRNIYLDIYDATNKRSYYPIMIASHKVSYTGSNNETRESTTEVAQSSPQLNKLGGRLYATWVEDGHNFALVDLTKTLQTLLCTDGISGLYTGADDLITVNASGDSDKSKATKTNYTKATTTNYVAAASLDVATPSEYSDKARSNTSVNGIKLSAETNNLLKALRANMTGNAAEFNVNSDPRSWNKVISNTGEDTGWLSNGCGWNETDYTDVSARIKSYYTRLYTEAFKDKDNKYTAEQQKQILDDIQTDTFAKEMYDSTVFGRIANKDIERYMIDVSGYDGSSGIGEYKLAYDGTDVYVLYIDACDEPEHLGTELFGMRFRKSSEADDEKEDEWTSGDGKQEGGFTAPVMISVDNDDDCNNYMDEIDVCMDSGKNMYVVSNSFEIGTGEDGGKVYGAADNNTLMYYYFEPGGSIRVDEDTAEFSSSLVKGTVSNVSFYIENHGLFDASGYDVYAEVVEADKSTVVEAYGSGISGETVTETIKAGQRRYISLDWGVPETDLSGCYLHIVAKEKGYDNAEESFIRIPSAANIDITDEDISYDGEKITVKATFTNIGNEDGRNITVKLYNTKGSKNTEMQQQYVGTLKSGESKKIEFSFVPTAKTFNSFGYIDLKLAAMSGDEELKAAYPSLMPNMPVLCEINGGIDELKLNEGETKQLTVEVVPWSSAADTPSYSSSDPTVAYVDENGVLHAVGGGECIIIVYYSKLGLSEILNVSVKGKKTGGRNRGSEALAGYGTYGSPVKGAVRGDWQLQADGKWMFTGNGRRYTSEWAYVYNPYATGGQEQYDWFRFDASGNMVTGWYQDADGKWYYLWEVSNNLLGHMVTGWNYIGGKWYYFSNENGGPLGSMLYSTRTPDGYYVGPDGAWNGLSAFVTTPLEAQPLNKTS